MTRQRTRARTFRPWFMMWTCPEANRSATVATVSSWLFAYELTAKIKSPKHNGLLATLRLFISVS
jgi:hypothetical protein